MTRLSKGRQVILALGVVVLVAVLGAVITFIAWPWEKFGQPQTSHESPALVVEEYLTALSNGDAQRATELDGHIIDGGLYEQTDASSFLNDETLGSAVERISDISVEVRFANDEIATVDYSFALAGESYSSGMNLDWDADADTWVMDGSLASRVSVYAVDPETLISFPDFTLSSVDPSAASEGYARLGYVVYPAVYELDVQIDPATLVNAAETPLQQEIVVDPGNRELTVTFPVLAG